MFERSALCCNERTAAPAVHDCIALPILYQNWKRNRQPVGGRKRPVPGFHIGRAAGEPRIHFTGISMNRSRRPSSCWPPEGFHRERNERQGRAAISANGGEILPGLSANPHPPAASRSLRLWRFFLQQGHRADI